MYSKSLLFIIVSLLYTCFSFSQDFDANLEQLAKTIATKLNGKEKTKIAVWGFVTENGERTSLGNYITEDFSVYITNFGDNFEVIDRNHLDVLLNEHELNSEGYIDNETAKELGKIIAVDAIITGTFTVLETKVKVRAKVLDTETALQFAAAIANLPINEDVASYLGISVNGGNTTNRGFNRPLNSNETINNPDTVDPKCKEQLFGDLCFSNSTNEKMIVRIRYFNSPDTDRSGTNSKTIFLDIKETKCIYKLYNRPITYQIITRNNVDKYLDGNPSALSSGYSIRYLKDKGEIKIETCKSKTFTIK